jgi:leucyl-tRNA synthetase
VAVRRYNPKDIEPKWQKYWEEQKLYQVDESADKPKYYALEFFPYPSGVTMHVGHVRNYVISDTNARYKRMQNFNVLHPMGWDAFGLPAENYAIKHNVPPRKSTDDNIAVFKRQLSQVGLSYDWSREIDSSSPEYYRWTQWLFLKFHEKGLAYKAEAPVNWCPQDKTVLANEQVIKADGKNVCERCGSEVEKRQLSQWMLKITEYADRLLSDLDDLDWPESIKTMQRNWIGKSRGAEIWFGVVPKTDEPADVKAQIIVFTTRPDTLFGATFMVMAPEHPLVPKLTTAEQKAEVERYVKQSQAKSDVERQQTDREKTGVFTGAYAINPVNDQKIPIWIADYVLMGYGTGAIMAVPAHDERDYEFAKKFDLPVIQTFMPIENDSKNPPKNGYDEIERETVIVHLRDKSTGKYALLDWHGSLEGITTAIMGGIDKGQTAQQAALAEINEEAGISNARIVKELRWITGARYCASHKQQNRKAITTVLLAEVGNLDLQGQITKAETDLHTLVWVNENDVMDRLVPDHQKFVWGQLHNETALTGEGQMMNSRQYNGMSTSEARDKIVTDLVAQGVATEKVNYRMRDWLISRQRYWGAPIPILYCQKCGTVPVPEDQLPVELPPLESYEPSDDGRSPLARVPEFVHARCPQCDGSAERETDTMDTFVDSSWYFLRFTDPHNTDLPFDKDKADYWMPVDSYVGGAEHAVAHLLFARFWMKFLYDQGMVKSPEPFKRLRNQGMIGGADGRKMGKRYGNVVTPDDLIEQGYGADALRLFELFIAPFDQGTPWSTTGVPGTYRFLQRVWVLVQELLENETDKSGGSEALLAVTHRTIKKVSQDMEDFSLNTAVAAMMEMVNELYKLKAEHGFTDRGAWQTALTALTQLLAPFAPHISEELWQQLGHEGSVHLSSWPVHDEKYLVEDKITIVVQVNGKVRANLQLPADATEETIVNAAKADPNAANYLRNKEIRKTIYVPHKLINFVI